MHVWQYTYLLLKLTIKLIKGFTHIFEPTCNFTLISFSYTPISCFTPRYSFYHNVDQLLWSQPLFIILSKLF